MSILIKRTSSSSSGSPKGYLPGDVYNVNIILKSDKTPIIKFSDPENLVVGGSTLSTWGSTILIRKEGSIPASPTDGTVVITNTTKNKYSTDGYNDTSIDKNKTYYYRFFTMSTDKVCNNNSTMIYPFACQLNSNAVDWKFINDISESGVASSVWNVGDEIDITLTGKYAQTLTFQIWDFDYFDKADGTGKAGIVFGMKNLMKDKYALETIENFEAMSVVDTWKFKYLRQYTLLEIFDCLPADLQSVIKLVNTYAYGGNNFCNSKDKLYIPSSEELIKGSNSEKDAYQLGTFKMFPYHNSSNITKFIKKLNNGAGEACEYWTRSLNYYTNDDRYKIINADGRSSISSWESTTCGLCLMFNV